MAFDAPALLLVLLGDVEGHRDFCAPPQSWTAVQGKLLCPRLSEFVPFLRRYTHFPESISVFSPNIVEFPRFSLLAAHFCLNIENVGFVVF